MAKWLGIGVMVVLFKLDVSGLMILRIENNLSEELPLKIKNLGEFLYHLNLLIHCFSERQRDG